MIAAIGSAERGQGFGVHVIPLRNISAPEMAKIAQPFLPADRILKADASRPLLIVAGTPQEVSLLLQLVNTFDVDWLKGVSFGMFPLETAKASDLAKELEAMVGTAGGGEREGASGPLAGMVKFVPVDRLNSILVVSQRPQYIAAIRKWIQALDKTKSSDTPRLYVYYPQNSKADALASTLGDIFSSGRGRSGPDFNVAPGQPGADLYSSPGGGAAGPLGGFGGGGFGGGGFGGGAASGVALAEAMAVPTWAGASPRSGRARWRASGWPPTPLLRQIATRRLLIELQTRCWVRSTTARAAPSRCQPINRSGSSQTATRTRSSSSPRRTTTRWSSRPSSASTSHRCRS